MASNDQCHHETHDHATVLVHPCGAHLRQVSFALHFLLVDSLSSIIVINHGAETPEWMRLCLKSLECTNARNKIVLEILRKALSGQPCKEAFEVQLPSEMMITCQGIQKPVSQLIFRCLFCGSKLQGSAGHLAEYLQTVLNNCHKTRSCLG